MPTVKLASRRRLPHRQTERPTFGSPRPEQKCHKTQRQYADAKENHLELRGGENENPSKQRNQCWHRIKPHAIWSRHFRRVPAQQHQPENLSHELHQDTRDDQRINHRAERKETRDDRNRSKHEQRNVREILRGMQPSERAKEVAALSRREWNAAISQQQ